jgi:hypothetical protein
MGAVSKNRLADTHMPMTIDGQPVQPARHLIHPLPNRKTGFPAWRGFYVAFGFGKLQHHPGCAFLDRLCSRTFLTSLETNHRSTVPAKYIPAVLKPTIDFSPATRQSVGHS